MLKSFKIHYITRSSKNAGEWEFADELRRLCPGIKYIAGEVKVRYSRRIFLLLAIYPRMVLFAVKSAVRSLLREEKPDAVLLESDVEILCYSLVQVLATRHKPLKLFCGFIYTGNSNRFLEELKHTYYSLVLSLVNAVIVYSNNECTLYAKVFPRHAHKFSFAPFGIGAPRPKLAYGDQPRRGFLLSAGRSGRDYGVLVEAVRPTGYPCQILCDSFDTLPDALLTDRIVAVRDSFDDDYIDRLFAADLVVIPLLASDISAGQMVLLHAMAYRKPIIVTDTVTIRDYIHLPDCVRFVPQSDAVALRAAIEELMQSPETRAALAARAGENFDRHHSTAAMARGYCRVIAAAAAARQAS